MKLLLLAFCMLPWRLFASPPGGKYAIGLFHFNFQYVAGDYKIERRIIRESLFPVLQFFDKHPEYRSDIEMQGYAVEVLAEEHPDVLALLKKLVRRGQIELVVAHYSDQLFIGYPAEDLQRSIALSDSVLAKYDLRRSPVFFGQEFQWSPALASALKGRYDVVVTSADPNNWYNGGGAPLVNVVYGGDTIKALIGGGVKDLSGLSWRIAFLDDGEEFNTKDYNSDFYRVPAQEQENIDKYKKLLAEGYRFVTVSELVQKMRQDTAYKVPIYPLVPEGTWHMKVCGPFMWMGRQRSGVETDGITRAVSYRLRGQVMLAQSLVAYAKKQGKDVTVLMEWLKQAWEHLLLSEVSDSSGWDPWLVEVQYTDNEAATAEKLLAQIMEQLRKLLSVTGAGWTVDTKSGVVSAGGLDATAAASAGVPAALPVDFSVLAERYSASVQKLNDSLYQMDIECMRPADGAVEISFSTAAQGLQYSPSCGEDRSVVIPTDYPHDPAFALANGFIYLNNGYSLVKDCSVEHLAATWRVGERRLVFREELREGNNSMRMRFFFVKGTAARGLAFANALNTWPTYQLGSNGVWERRIPAATR